MTDKEIIKALECCFVQRNHSKCPLKGFGSTVVDCRYGLAMNAIELITAQQSQIEDLYITLDERIQRIKELESEIKQLKERLDAKRDICIERERTAAIGEFAWRLKLLLTPYPDCDFKEPVTSKQIDTLVKEMTEDTDNA